MLGEKVGEGRFAFNGTCLVWEGVDVTKPGSGEIVVVFMNKHNLDDEHKYPNVWNISVKIKSLSCH